MRHFFENRSRGNQTSDSKKAKVEGSGSKSKQPSLLRLISFVCVFSLLLGIFPTRVFAADTGGAVYMEVISSTAPLRKGPSEKEEIAATVYKGDCLQVIGKTRNIWGNVWYQVSYAGKTLYCYSTHLTQHLCEYTPVSDELSICKCGSYRLEERTSTTQTSISTTAGSLITPDLAAAAAYMGSVIVGGLAAAFPYVAIVTVGGLIIYIAVSSSGTQVKVEDVIVLHTESDVDLYQKTFDPSAPYHKACTLSGTGAILILREGMDLNTANKYLRDTVRNPAYATVTALSKKAMLSIWCALDNDAANLAERFEKNGIGYGYGTSSDSNRGYEINQDDDECNNYWFQHYHLWYAPYNQFMKKVVNAHIFFGAPVQPKKA